MRRQRRIYVITEPNQFAHGGARIILCPQVAGVVERHTVLPRRCSLCSPSAWLYGYDEYSGLDYSHRKVWILDRLEFLASMFAMERLCVRCDAGITTTWSCTSIARVRCTGRSRKSLHRWTRLFAAPPIIERWQSGQSGEAERGSRRSSRIDARASISARH